MRSIGGILLARHRFSSRSIAAGETLVKTKPTFLSKAAGQMRHDRAMSPGISLTDCDVNGKTVCVSVCDCVCVKSGDSC